MAKRRHFSCATLCTALLCTSLLAAGPDSRPAAAAESAAQGVSEESVKAAFVFKFLGYVEWPAGAFKNAKSPLVIGVTADSGIGNDLAEIVPGRTVNNREVVIRTIKPGDSLEGLHLLVIGQSNDRLAQLLGEAQQRSVLTVTESPGALAFGSVINFVVMAGKVRFEISLESAEKNGIKLSSRLLPVASRVVQKKI